MSGSAIKDLARALGEHYDKLLLWEGLDREFWFEEVEAGRGTYLAGPFRRCHGGYEHVETGQFVALSDVLIAGLAPARRKP